ncbi:hypothetical protein PN36_28210 [Candidatus Thiomargarita nelsonii]|uniref:Uncharacterized protein n=1 Tax=Candidatus Thiomargarita nelsonii TaxID=1003181 RepID=A0A0A6P2J4_9GAMM|nr:hypothetical protein PN36_28210 [Candidatus Thiomargarita nelsonii]
MSKTCLNISLDQDLMDFVQGDNIETLCSDPDFYKALVDVQTKLRDGTGQWHTFEDVFGNGNKI